MNRISLCMIVKNEEKVLRRCLESIKDIVDEIVIVDTGSDDQTKKIAEEYTNNVFDFEWIEDFSAARNYALDKAIGEYCIVLDADEVLDSNAKESLKKFIKEGKRVIGRVKIENTFMREGELTIGSSWISRIFPKGIYYTGAIHEQIDSDLPRKNVAITLHHDGYLNDNKVNRNLPILLKELKRTPDDAYLLYQTGKQYKLDKNYHEAVEYYIQAYNLVQKQNGFKHQITIDLIYLLMYLKVFDIAIEIVELEEKNMTKYAEFYFVKALLYTEICAEEIQKYSGYIGEIEKAYRKCIAIGEQEDIGGTVGTGTYLAYYNLGVYYELFGENSKAVECYRKSEKYGYKKAIEKVAILNLSRDEEHPIQENSDIRYKVTSIIVLTYNQLEYTKKCIESIRNFTNKEMYELIVVDNASTDGTREWLRQQLDIRLIFNDTNLGFPKGCNQGIEVATGENILLLNNDVIVTPKWLETMLKCLYSDTYVGAVGPVSNNIVYYQQIDTNYTTIEEMLEFARKFNKSDSDKWEERLKLVGFCMLIKKEVINKIGMLDERFTPGNYEDDDYSIRILQEGYKLKLCKDVFVHHFGSVSFRQEGQKYNTLLQTNKQKFIDKWGFDPGYSMNIRKDLIKLIEDEIATPIRVLEVGCGAGATLLAVKNKYKKAEIHGIELCEGSAKVGKYVANVLQHDIEKPCPYPDQYFDYIICGDVLEHLYNPWKVVKDLKRYIKQDGNMLVSLPNIMHHSVVKDLLQGKWQYTDAGILDRTHLRFFTFTEIEIMFQEARYVNVEFSGKMLNDKEEEIEWIENLQNVLPHIDKTQFLVYQYLVKGRVDHQVDFIINMLENLDNVETDIFEEFLINIDNNNNFTDTLIEVLKKVKLENAIEAIHIIVIKLYERSLFNNILVLLNFALELDASNKETLYNMGAVLETIGEIELAKEYFDKANED